MTGQKLWCCVKEALTLAHPEEQMASFEREQLRLSDAGMHLLGQRIGNGLVLLAVQNQRWRVYFTQPVSTVEHGRGSTLPPKRVPRLGIFAPEDGHAGHQTERIESPGPLGARREGECQAQEGDSLCGA